MLGSPRIKEAQTEERERLSARTNTFTGALCHTNDDHYSLGLKGRAVDRVTPFTKTCPPHVMKPGCLHPPTT